MLKIRDEAKDNEIINIKRATATTMEDSNHEDADDKENDIDIADGISPSSKIKLKNKIRNRKNSLKNLSPQNVMKSDGGQTLVLEYIAPRRSCRVNIKISAFANGKNEP